MQCLNFIFQGDSLVFKQRVYIGIFKESVQIGDLQSLQIGIGIIS